MKAIISVLNDLDEGFEFVGAVKTIGGTAVGDQAATRFVLPTLVEPGTMATLTPSDGDRYVAALPAQYAHSSRIAADIVSDSWQLDDRRGESSITTGTPPGRGDRIVRFDRQLATISAAIYAAQPELSVDHTAEYPWLTGQLGDPWAPVWFIAESPSLGQVERVGPGATKNTQWNISNADALLRRMLVEAGFKDPPGEGPDGWRCYITDVIKSAEHAKAMGNRSQANRDEMATAWAPALCWELEHGNPRLIITVGRSADRLLKRLIRDGGIKCPLPLEFVTHYTSIARFPDHLGRRAMHPDRVADYARDFQRLALAATASPRTGNERTGHVNSATS
jgi:Uracil DNA glycosylase superfamily